MMEAKVVLVDPIDRDPFYAVYFKSKDDWNIVKVFSYRIGGEGIWSQEKNLADAMELAKRIEASPGEVEVVIYQTQDDEK